MTNDYKIIVPFHNVERWIKVCIRSIKKQTIKDFQCILIDDASTDNTVEVVNQEIANDNRFTLIRNDQNLGALENIYNAIEKSKPDDESIIINLDGDDWFANPNVLQTLNRYYSSDCLMTYGSHVVYPGGMRSKFCKSPVPKWITESRAFRESEWMTSALRTFKYKIWRRIDINDLKDSNGNFYKTAWDLAYMFPMLEMSGPKAKFVKEILYVYNQHDNNDHVVPEKRVSQLKNEHEIRKKKKYKRFHEYTEFNDGTYLNDNPKELLSWLRFDVLAKTLFIRHKLKGVEQYVAKKVYEDHLEVWGGFTEKNPVKNNINDFYKSFHEIIESIQLGGFDRFESTVPVDSNGHLLNGSHRLSACIVLNKPIVCKPSAITSGQKDCSSFYFMNKKDIVSTGLSQDVCDEMAIEFLRVHGENVYMASLYGHCKDRMSEIFEIFRNNSIDVVYLKDICLSEFGKINYVTSLYGEESWIGNVSNNLSGARQQASLNFIKGPCFKSALLYSKNYENIVIAKNQIRELLGFGKPSIHITDTFEEAFKNATTCFHDPTIEFMNKAKPGWFNEKKIRNFVKETKEIFEKSSLSNEDYCIGGSALLLAYGLRDIKDFDVVHLDSNDSIRFNENISSHNGYLSFYPDDKEKLIFDRNCYIYLHGIKFLSLSKIVEMKLNRSESKDLHDVQKAEKILKKSVDNISILAAGPPKKNRNRHLEVFAGVKLIDSVINKCRIDGVGISVVINKNNIGLISHVERNHPDVKILKPEDEKVRSTFKAALSPLGNCLMVCGDLTSFSQSDIKKFVYCEHKSATSKYAIPWGSNVRSKTGNIIRRADVGDAISLIADSHKEEFMSLKNENRAKELFHNFYPDGNQFNNMNEFFYNDVGTFTSFAFFEEIWKNPEVSKHLDKGCVVLGGKSYEDND